MVGGRPVPIFYLLSNGLSICLPDCLLESPFRCGLHIECLPFYCCRSGGIVDDGAEDSPQEIRTIKEEKRVE